MKHVGICNAFMAGYAAGYTARRDRDAAEGGDAKAAPVPQDQQARPEGIAHE